MAARARVPPCDANQFTNPSTDRCVLKRELYEGERGGLWYYARPGAHRKSYVPARLKSLVRRVGNHLALHPYGAVAPVVPPAAPAVVPPVAPVVPPVAPVVPPVPPPALVAPVIPAVVLPPVPPPIAPPVAPPVAPVVPLVFPAPSVPPSLAGSRRSSPNVVYSPPARIPSPASTPSTRTWVDSSRPPSLGSSPVPAAPNSPASTPSTRTWADSSRPPSLGSSPVPAPRTRPSPAAVFVEVRPSTIPDAGHGLFALRDFKANQFITGVAGVDIAVPPDYAGGTHVVQLKKNLVRDGNPALLEKSDAYLRANAGAIHIERDGLGQFCNTKPRGNNAEIRISWRDGIARVAIRATRNISAGDEIFVPYRWARGPQGQGSRPPAPPALAIPPPPRASSLQSLPDPPTPPPYVPNALSTPSERSSSSRTSTPSRAPPPPRTPSPPPLAPPPLVPPPPPALAPPPPPSSSATESDEEESYHPQVAGLLNVSNSCYMDSTLMALFANRNRVIEEYVLNADVADLARTKRGACRGLSAADDQTAREALRVALRDVNARMHDMSARTQFNCVNLRGAIRGCPMAAPAPDKGLRRSTRLVQRGPADFSGGEMQDPEEFLRFLMEKYAVERNLQIDQNLMSEDGVHWERTSEHRSRVTVVKLDTASGKPVRTGEVLQYEHAEPVPPGYKQPEGKAYKWRKHRRTVAAGDYLVVSVNRAMGGGRVNAAHVHIDDQIGPLHLHAVVCYKPGHYVCYLKLRGRWVLYDDMRRGFTEIGDLGDLMGAKPSPYTSGCQYYYSKPSDNANG